MESKRPKKRDDKKVEKQYEKICHLIEGINKDVRKFNQRIDKIEEVVNKKVEKLDKDIEIYFKELEVKHRIGCHCNEPDCKKCKKRIYNQRYHEKRKLANNNPQLTNLPIEP